MSITVVLQFACSPNTATSKHGAEQGHFINQASTLRNGASTDREISHALRPSRAIPLQHQGRAETRRGSTETELLCPFEMAFAELFDGKEGVPCAVTLLGFS